MSDIAKISQIVLETNFVAEHWMVPIIPKEKDTRGFIYIVQDKKYPDLLKVGKTIDFVKRVKQYNVDRPYEDVTPVLCTRLIGNVDYVEKYIKNHLTETFSSVGKSQEWFPKEVYEEILKILEDEFDHQYTIFGEGLLEHLLKGN